MNIRSMIVSVSALTLALMPFTSAKAAPTPAIGMMEPIAPKIYAIYQKMPFQPRKARSLYSLG